MSYQFEIDNQIRLATSLDMPLTKVPLARWQRKNLENSTSSINNSLNASLLLNLGVENSNISINNISYNSNNLASKTPSTTPTRTTPSRHNGVNKGSNKKNKTPKTPIGPDRFIPNRNAMNLEISHYLV